MWRRLTRNWLSTLLDVEEDAVHCFDCLVLAAEQAAQRASQSSLFVMHAVVFD
jgi:hypothetical protein